MSGFLHFYHSGPVYHEYCDCPEPDAPTWQSTMECPAEEPQMMKDFSAFPSIDLQRLLQEVPRRFSNRGGLIHYAILNNQVYRRSLGKYTDFKMFSDEMLLSLSRKVKWCIEAFCYLAYLWTSISRWVCVCRSYIWAWSLYLTYPMVLVPCQKVNLHNTIFSTSFKWSSVLREPHIFATVAERWGFQMLNFTSMWETGQWKHGRLMMFLGLSLSSPGVAPQTLEISSYPPTTSPTPPWRPWEACPMTCCLSKATWVRSGRRAGQHVTW